MSQDLTRLGLIGVGAIAQVNHLPALARMKDVEIYAVCDDDPEKSRVVAERFKVPHALSDYERLLRLDDFDSTDEENRDQPKNRLVHGHSTLTQRICHKIRPTKIRFFRRETQTSVAVRLPRRIKFDSLADGWNGENLPHSGYR